MKPKTDMATRDTLTDAYEEALDLCMYLRQRIEEERINKYNLKQLIMKITPHNIHKEIKF